MPRVRVKSKNRPLCDESQIQCFHIYSPSSTEILSSQEALHCCTVHFLTHFLYYMSKKVVESVIGKKGSKLRTYPTNPHPWDYLHTQRVCTIRIFHSTKGQGMVDKDSRGGGDEMVENVTNGKKRKMRLQVEKIDEEEKEEEEEIEEELEMESEYPAWMRYAPKTGWKLEPSHGPVVSSSIAPSSNRFNTTAAFNIIMSKRGRVKSKEPVGKKSRLSGKVSAAEVASLLSSSLKPLSSLHCSEERGRE